ncbi:SDR family oxidoreductase [Kribbella qitaiheensis]|uniref:SDR family oxidoreductase n=1 Tax=Kribbella qitaiheensis TaxID=1544730 RepID=A0A7G6X663_9ACTN|nr:SDR family oxidoreductase [Kribbella qitaiheensis]QNE21728.1 SDR family oxidoreductase [Kribbella qitaiheensis]
MSTLDPELSPVEVEPGTASLGLIGVTGATGQLGSRVARQLAESGIAQRLVVRDPARAPELSGAEVAQAAYGDSAALLNALDGVHTLLLVSASESADRVSLHKATIDAAVAAGVRRIVYTSFVAAAPSATFTFARDHWHTEQHIIGTGVDYTFLRDNLYLDFIPGFAGEDGVIRGPAGDGRVAAVLREDVAEAAARVVADPSHSGKTYDLTGPAAFTLAEAAAMLSDAWGKPIRYEAETLDEAYRSRESFGAPAWEVAGWVTSYAAIASGELSTPTTAIEEITGRPPTALSTYLARPRPS